MKYFFRILCLLSTSVFTGCLLESNCPNITTDANFIVKTQDFYTNEPIKGRSVRFDRVDSRNVLTTLSTNDLGTLTAKIKYTTFCDEGHQTVLNLLQSDTSEFFPVKVTPKCSFPLSTGDVNITFLYKRKSANLLLKIVHKDTLNNSLKMMVRKSSSDLCILSSNSASRFTLYEEVFNTQAPNEANRLIKVLPQEDMYIDYSYFTGSKLVSKSDYIRANLTDTLKFTITY